MKTVFQAKIEIDVPDRLNIDEQKEYIEWCIFCAYPLDGEEEQCVVYDVEIVND